MGVWEIYVELLAKMLRYATLNSSSAFDSEHLIENSVHGIKSVGQFITNNVIPFVQIPVQGQ
jgi:hypothetical protein